MATPPLRTELSDNFPIPSNATLRTGMGKLYDYVTGLLGATGNAAEARTALGIASEPYIYIRDEKASATSSGGFTSGAWRVRALNTEVNDASNLATLAGNQITLAAGTYRFSARAPGYNVASHKCRLQNITDSISYGGSSSYSVTGAQSESVVSGRFTIAAAKVFELQHQCSLTNASNGFGVGAGFGVNEVYAEIEFWKEV